MARMLWKDRIGEEKTVNDITFKFVDYVDGMVIVVDSVNHDTYEVSKNVWNGGVFRDIMKKLNKAPLSNSKYVGAIKVIEGVEFKVEKYVKGKVIVVAKGYEGFKEMLVATWKKARFFKNIMKVLIKIVEKVQEKVKEIKEKKYELVIYNDFQKDFIGRLTHESMSRIEREFNRCMTTSDVRKLYKYYAKYTHPDLGYTDIVDTLCFKWLTSLRDIAIATIEFWLEDDED